ncbi:MAG: hypothetical protein AAF235_03170 [Planctomycetota bacterium]
MPDVPHMEQVGNPVAGLQIPSAEPLLRPGVDARLLQAENEARQSRVISDVVDASLARAAELREEREAAQRADDERERRLEAKELLEDEQQAAAEEARVRASIEREIAAEAARAEADARASAVQRLDITG